MKISHSIAVLPEAPPLSSLIPGQAFSFTTGSTTDRTYMLVEPWVALAEELSAVGGAIQFAVYVDLDTGRLYNSKDRSRTVNVLHSEVLVA